MPSRLVYSAQIEFLQILDEHGQFDEKLGRHASAGGSAGNTPESVLSDERAAELFDFMITCRAVDEIAFKLQRAKRMGTYPQNKGQEAAAIGTAAAAIIGTDWLIPCYRENAALWMHGLPMHNVFLHWMGDERGNQIPKGILQTPLSIPIGTHMLHAAGIAYASKVLYKKSGGSGEHPSRVVLTYFGDGATSEGDFHEAMNFASVYQAPVVFVCQNNHWAISVPREMQMNSETVAQKAIAYGMPTIQVDGNDLFAVYKVAKEAIDRARAGGGPSFIEAVTYRLADHTTADDARRYRDAKELEAWLNKDPILRLRKYLTAKGLWSDAKHAEAETKGKKVAEDVAKAAESLPTPTSDEFFDHMFAQPLPPELEMQKRTMRTSSLGQNPDQAGLKAGTRGRESGASTR
jgi:pyruvate dehydrogenase E1 component alpha subunit